MDSCWEIDRNEWRDNAQVILNSKTGDHVAEAYGEDGLALKRARLIAAAPEMYELLTECITCLSMRHTMSSDAHKSVTNRIDAVIARARGVAHA